MKIYTKTGDKGSTSLIGGKRIPKYHPKIEAYGTVDELISHMGLIRDMNIDNDTKNSIIFIQDRLMRCASILATDSGNKNCKNYEIPTHDIEHVENEIDKMDKELPQLSSFILPGGHISVSYCHIARTVCRRAERRVTELAQSEEVDINVLIFLNRLSDYLFTLSRSLSKKFNATEVPWKY